MQQYYEKNGIVQTLIWFITKSLKWILLNIINLRKFYLLEKNLAENIPYIRAKIDVTYKLADLKDLEYFQGLLKPKKLKMFERRLQRGQNCIACFYKTRAIGYIWISFVPESDRNLGLTSQPHDDESYGFDLYVLPEYRKFVIGYELISRWFMFSQDAGKRKVMGLVEEINKPMLITIKIVFGFKTIKCFRILEILRRYGIVFSKKEIA